MHVLKKYFVFLSLVAACSGCVSQEELTRYELLKAYEKDLDEVEVALRKNAQILKDRYDKAVNRGTPVSWVGIGGEIFDIAETINDSLRWVEYTQWAQED